MILVLYCFSTKAAHPNRILTKSCFVYCCLPTKCRTVPVRQRQQLSDLFVMAQKGGDATPPRAPTVQLVSGDITVQEVDAIVNAANSYLLVGGGVDGAIHRAAGRELAEYCYRLNGCETGKAKISPGFKLHAKHIIHTVGPIWDGGDDDEPQLLESCYKECLARADEVDARTIAFPAISTGIYEYPQEDAARIALRTVLNTPTKVEQVRFVAFDKETFEAYEKILAEHQFTNS